MSRNARQIASMVGYKKRKECQFLMSLYLVSQATHTWKTRTPFEFVDMRVAPIFLIMNHHQHQLYHDPPFMYYNFMMITISLMEKLSTKIEYLAQKFTFFSIIISVKLVM